MPARSDQSRPPANRIRPRANRKGQERALATETVHHLRMSTARQGRTAHRTDTGVVCEAFEKGLESLRGVRRPLGSHRGRGRRVLPALQSVHRCATGTPASQPGSSLPFRGRSWHHGPAGPGSTTAPCTHPLPGPQLGTEPAPTPTCRTDGRHRRRPGDPPLRRTDPAFPSGTSRSCPPYPANPAGSQARFVAQPYR